MTDGKTNPEKPTINTVNNIQRKRIRPEETEGKYGRRKCLKKTGSYKQERRGGGKGRGLEEEEEWGGGMNCERR